MLDDTTLANKKRNPYPRDLLADVLAGVEQAHPKFVIIDIFLEEPGDPKQDDRLAHLMARHGNVLLPIATVVTDQGPELRWPDKQFYKSAKDCGVSAFYSSPESGVDS